MNVIQDKLRGESEILNEIPNGREIGDYFSLKNFHIGFGKNFRSKWEAFTTVLKALCVQTAYIIGLIYRSVGRERGGGKEGVSSSNYLRICCEIIVVEYHFNRAFHFILSNRLIQKGMFHCSNETAFDRSNF